MDMQPEVFFREVQRFRQPLIWGLLAVVSLLSLGSALYFVLRGPLPGKPSDPVGVFFGVIFPLIVLAAVIALLASAKLVTEVRADGVAIRFVPFHRTERLFPYDAIEECVARTYRPIWEYGGWGIRWGFSGRAYNVSGNEGVQLRFRDGKRLLIGSQRAKALADAINVARTSPQ